MTLVIGLTGPIGCGKSTIAARLAEHGGLVIDADRVAHQVTGPGRPALTVIRARFGDAVFGPDGALDRGALAAVVFDDPAALRDLEAIVHPAVRTEIEAQLADPAASATPFVAIEAIRLVEGGLAARCREVWLVVCDGATQRTRLTARGMQPDDIERRLAAQVDLAARLAPAATRVLRTDGPLATVLAATDAALAEALEGERAGDAAAPG